MTTTSDPMTLTARCPEDVLAMVPVVLGFVPTDSVVMLTFGAQEAFHARIDLPETLSVDPELLEEQVSALCGALLAPATCHRAHRVLFVVYSANARQSGVVGRRLEHDFGRARIDIVEMLRADGRRWFPLVGKRPGVPEWGVPYDLSSHRFSAEAVMHGRITHGSRVDLSDTLTADESQVRATTAALERTVATWERGAIPSSGVLLTEGAWVQDLLRRHLGSADLITDQDLVRLLRGIDLLRVRDAAWALMDRPSAEDHVAFWSDVVRRSPLQWVTPAATLAGWAAWQAGHGALAWCAVDRAEAGDPDYTLLNYLAHALQNAIPPSTWTPTAEWDAGLLHSA
ncbi:DUF4192 domain-containing protein [Nocardioides salsibiostraticola]